MYVISLTVVAEIFGGMSYGLGGGGGLDWERVFVLKSRLMTCTSNWLYYNDCPITLSAILETHKT